MKTLTKAQRRRRAEVASILNDLREDHTADASKPIETEEKPDERH